MRSPVKAAVRKTAPSSADEAARTSAQTSSGEKACRSSETRMRGRSTAVIGFDGSPHTFIARRKIPCMTTRYLWIVRLETVRVAFQCSMAPALTSSSRSSPKARRGSANRVAVVGQRGGLAGPLVLGPAQPLGRGVGEGRAGPHHPREQSTACRGQQIVQPRLGAPLREVAGGRPTARRPRRADELLALAPVREPVLGVPLRPAAPLDAEDVARKWGSRGPPLAGYRTRFSGHIRDMLTIRKRISGAAATA